MTREEVLAKVNEIIQEVFDDEDIQVTDATVASDVDGWDSLMHITLIGTIEDEFDIKFAMKDVVGMKNVGQMVDLILEQLD
ncbi:acyl carrier protein [Pseudobutyrivibrio sp. YE44]|uniref:acyl carrier protein n=1 Tax=Pseudobutyrivibrio sp. YE44 TaxID=1520802 RepID=UPI0008863FFA|nr:acyl carrier protein [Pseudobutyrivibrio sp. YE44]SDB38535.1 acyl carrier protein [Pseudobutyrivibrio sp. YE44]